MFQLRRLESSVIKEREYGINYFYLKPYKLKRDQD